MSSLSFSALYNVEGVVHFASAAASGAVAIVIAAFGVLICVRGGRRQDPARVAIPWLKLAFLASFLGFALGCVADIIYGVCVTTDFNINGYEQLLDVQWGIGIVAGFLRRLLDPLLVLVFAELGNGFLYTLLGPGQARQKLVRGLAAASSIILLVFAIVDVAFRGQLPHSFDSQQSDELLKLRLTNRIAAGAAILKLFIAVAVLVQGCIVKHKYRAATQSSQTVTLYLVATILDAFPLSLWTAIGWGANSLGPVDQSWTATVSISCDIVFITIPTCILLVLLAVVAVRTHYGLWATVQPWMQQVQQPTPGCPTSPHTNYVPHYPSHLSEAFGQQRHEIPGIQPPHRHMLHGDGIQLAQPMQQEQEKFELKA